MKKIVFLMPYFGAWPEWMNLFIETCKFNPSVDWIFFTNCPEPENKCPNVRYVPMTFQGFGELVHSRLGVHFSLKDINKICDIRPGFGTMYSEYIEGYDFFGWSDVDTVYGNIRKFITDDVLQHSVISCHSDNISGHFCLFENTPRMRAMHLLLNDWKKKMEDEKQLLLEEIELYQIFSREKTSYLKEQYAQHLSRNRPWRDGTYTWPTEWYWKNNTLTNDKDLGIEFLYLHFMVWKGGKWGKEHGGGQWEKLDKLVHFDWRDAPSGWKITENGFFKL